MWHFFRQIGIGVLLAYTLAGGARGERRACLRRGSCPTTNASGH